MKVAPAFLPKVRLNKILPASVLNLHLCMYIYIFSFILFILVFYLLLSFLLRRFIVLENSVSRAVALRRTTVCGFTCTKKCLQNQVWPFSVHFTGIFAQNGKLLTFFTYNCFFQVKVALLSKRWLLITLRH